MAVSIATLHAAAASAGVPLWQYLADGAPVSLPMPEIQIFGGGAHAGRRIDIQDLMVMATAATSFEQAIEMTAEVYLAAGRLMAESGRRQGVADEGGYWPVFDSNEEAIETLVRAIEAAGFVPGQARSPSRSTSPPPNSAPTAATGSGSSRANSTATACASCLPAGAGAIPSSRSRIRWPRTTPQDCAASPRRSATRSR